MGMGKGIVGTIAENAAEVAKTAITKERAGEKKDEIEVSSVPENGNGKSFSFSKMLINVIVGGLVGIGGYIVIQVGKKHFDFQVILAFKDYVMAVTPLVGILIGVVGGGRAFKNSKWSKTE